MSSAGQAPGGDQSLGELVASIGRDVQDLVQGQIELTKAELRESAQAAAATGGLFAGAGFLGLLALVFALLTLGFGLMAAGLPAWAAFLIVTALLVIGAGVLALLGKRQSAGIKGPERSVASAKATAELLGGSHGE